MGKKLTWRALRLDEKIKTEGVPQKKDKALRQSLRLTVNRTYYYY
jgi:hypothetical protein